MGEAVNSEKNSRGLLLPGSLVYDVVARVAVHHDVFWPDKDV